MKARTLALTMMMAALAACGRKPEPAASSPPPVTSPAPQASSAPIPATPGASTPAPPAANAVSFEELIALLPDAEGWTRSKPRGEQVSIGTQMSHAQAEYQRNDASIDLEITDSAYNQLVLSPLATFLAVGFSERTTTGYTKSAKIGAHPGFEKWNSDARSGEVTVLVSNRFVVQATGHSVDSVAPVRALVQRVDLNRLAGMR